MPNYLPKDGYTTLVIGFVRLSGNKLILPYSNAYKKTHKFVEITIHPHYLIRKLGKSVSYRKQTLGSLKFNISMKLNVFKET